MTVHFPQVVARFGDANTGPRNGELRQPVLVRVAAPAEPKAIVLFLQLLRAHGPCR